MKTKTKRSRNFPLHDAISKDCSETGFSLLQWDFRTTTGWSRYSIQMPTDAVEQILEWRDIELNYRAGQGVL